MKPEELKIATEALGYEPQDKTHFRLGFALAHIKSLEAKNKKYREALENIYADNIHIMVPTSDYCVSPGCPGPECIQRACDEALKETEEK